MKNKYLKIILITLFVIVLELLFFRNVIFNNQLIEDTGDGRYITLMLEHYYDVVQGKEPAGQLRIFYPARHTLF